jgi:hypothetical protein
MLQDKYNNAAQWYEEKYVAGGWENNPYMKDEYDAHQFWMANGELGSIISLGCGSGQDIKILGNPHPKTFTGYDFSEGMLANARSKFPDYKFELQDCKLPINDSCDILVSMFGAPNYIGLEKLLLHFFTFKAKHAFFVFYNETYDDGFGGDHYKYTLIELKDQLQFMNATVLPLNENYYIVEW